MGGISASNCPTQKARGLVAGLFGQRDSWTPAVGRPNFVRLKWPLGPLLEEFGQPGLAGLPRVKFPRNPGENYSALFCGELSGVYSNTWEGGALFTQGGPLFPHFLKGELV